MHVHMQQNFIKHLAAEDRKTVVRYLHARGSQAVLLHAASGYSARGGGPAIPPAITSFLGCFLSQTRDIYDQCLQGAHSRHWGTLAAHAHAERTRVQWLFLYI